MDHERTSTWLLASSPYFDQGRREVLASRIPTPSKAAGEALILRVVIHVMVATVGVGRIFDKGWTRFPRAATETPTVVILLLLLYVWSLSP